MEKMSPGLVRQVFVLLFIVIVGALIFKEMIPYLSGVLGATTLYVLLRRMMVYLVKRGWRSSLAAIFLMSLSFLIIALPITLITMMLTSKVSYVIENSEKILKTFNQQVTKFENQIGFELMGKFDTDKITAWIAGNFDGMAGSAFNIFIAMGLMYFMLYYMLTNRKDLRASLIAYIPLSVENLIIVGLEVRSLVKSNAIGIPLVAILQGIVALIGFWALGVPDIFFWFVITTVGSMIPFVGTALGILPVCVLLFSLGQPGKALILLIYGFVVVASTDNVFRLFVQRRLADVHPLITLFGVIVGVPLFGFIGLIFGPLLVSLFLLIVKIYKVEYGKTEEKI